jgi:hypothetical protein
MSYMAATTHTMEVKLSHKVVVSLMRWLFREVTASSSLLYIIKNITWHCIPTKLDPLVQLLSFQSR